MSKYRWRKNGGTWTEVTGVSLPSLLSVIGADAVDVEAIGETVSLAPAAGADTTPNAFTFTDVTNATLSTVYTSSPITVSGINAPTSISVTGGLYGINGGAYTSASGVVNNGDQVRLRATSSNLNSTAVGATATIGGVADTFNITTAAVASDTTPNAFSFTDVTNASLSTVYTSDTVTISGINAATAVSVTGGQYSKNGGAFTASAGTVVNGDTLAVRATSSASNSQAVNVTLNVGGVTDVYTVTTAAVASDTTPDAFTFTDVTGATPSTVYTSNTVTITGINTAANLTISGGQYSINGGSWASSATTVNNNDTVQVRATASANNSTPVNVVLTVGGVNDTYTVTTAAGTPAVTNGIVFDGDSITEGPNYLNVTPAFPTQYSRYTGQNVVNLGVSSRTLDTMNTTYASRNVAANFNSATCNSSFVLGGINEVLNTSGITLSAMQASMTAYAAKATAAFTRVGVGTLLAVNGLTNDQNNLIAAFNTWLRANYASLGFAALADLAAIPALQNPPAGESAFFVDGLHPNTRGLSLIAQAVATAMGVPLIQYVSNGTYGTDAGGYIASGSTSDYSSRPVDPSLVSVVSGRLRVTCKNERLYPDAALPITGLVPGAAYTLTGSMVSSTEYGGRIFVTNTLDAPDGAPGVYDSADQEAPFNVNVTFTATQETHFLRLLAGCETPGTYTDFDNFSIVKVTSSFVAPVGFYRNGAANTALIAALNGVKNNTRQGKIVSKGDSTTVGSGGGTGSPYYYLGSRAYRPGSTFAAGLTALGVKTLDAGVVADNGSSVAGFSLTEYDPRVVFTPSNAWSKQPTDAGVGYTFAGGGYLANTGTGTLELTESGIDRFEVVYFNSSDGVYTFKIDGADPTVGPATVTCAAGGNFTRVVVGVGSVGTHTLRITATGNIALRGVMPFNSTAKSMNMVDHAVNGALTSTQNAQGSPPTDWYQREALKFDAPDLTFIKLGTNDLRDNTPISTVTAALSQMIDDAKITGDVLLIFPQPSGPSYQNQLSAMRAAYKSLAETKGISYLDLWEYFGGYTTGYAARTVDTVHPSRELYEEIGHVVMRDAVRAMVVGSGVFPA